MGKLLVVVLVFLDYGCFAHAQNASGALAGFWDMAHRMAAGEVEDITVSELRMQRSAVLLLDTRSKEEFEVSHIPGARWVGYKSFNPEVVSKLPKDTKIVVYCSVGYRSEKVGERLQELGFSKVNNLLGSIFAWSNAGLPMVDKDGRPTSKVHGYNQIWSKWLESGAAVLP